MGESPNTTASASNMAGAPNTTSPSIGASASRCSARSRISPIAGSFNDQNHSIGPTLFWNPGGGDEDEEAGEEGEGDDDNAKATHRSPRSMEFSLNVGVQFGLTDVTSDGALKFQGSACVLELGARAPDLMQEKGGGPASAGAPLLA